MITKNYIAKGEGANRFEKVPVRIRQSGSPGNCRSDPYECG